MALSVLVVDDDVSICEALTEFFETLGHRVRAAGSGTEATRLAERDAPDVALVDLRLPDIDGLALQRALRAADPELAVVLLTAHADVPTAVRAMREGAADFLEKPIDLDALAAAVDRAVEMGRLRREVSLLRARDLARESTPASSQAGASTPIAPTVERLVSLAAKHGDVPVLIVGETGTGKGFVARRIHESSTQRGAPFVEINCASLSATFFESELFGHERGAFTDAKQAKRGLLEVAGKGTVFLDEIGELAPAVQPKLLKVLEERGYRRLGGTSELRSEARILAATNQPLADLVQRGGFRADLYYRLQVLTIELAPLRARAAEIPALAAALAPRGARLTREALDALVAYPWPGNIRELKNVLWRAALLADLEPITPDHLALPMPPLRSAAPSSDAPRTLEEAERLAIADALRVSGGNKARAARLLGIARSTLLEKLRRFESASAAEPHAATPARIPDSEPR